jgi:hypothetical protein
VHASPPPPAARRRHSCGGAGCGSWLAGSTVVGGTARGGCDWLGPPPPRLGGNGHGESLGMIRPRTAACSLTRAVLGD